MSDFPKTLSRELELSCELVKEIERRCNSYASLEAARLQAQNATIDLDKQLAAANEQHARDVATLEVWNSAVTDLQQQLAEAQSVVKHEADCAEAYKAEAATNEQYEQDALRYRFLKTRAYVGVTRNRECLWVLRGIREVEGKGFNEAIDEEMSK